MSDLPLLPIEAMAERHPGLSEPIAAGYLEAARVCLDRHHSPPRDFVIDNSPGRISVAVVWEIATARVRAAWANEIDATEAAAYCCALAAVELVMGLVAIRRADTLSGADYYVAVPNTAATDLETCLRLEVSGTDAGTPGSINRRLREKINQARAGNSNLPALAAVVGFDACVVAISALIANDVA